VCVFVRFSSVVYVEVLGVLKKYSGSVDDVLFLRVIYIHSLSVNFISLCVCVCVSMALALKFGNLWFGNYVARAFKMRTCRDYCGSRCCC